MMQRNWIGPSEGALISFPMEGGPGRRSRSFTTRIDTIYGATFMLLSPDHPLSRELVADSSEKEERRAGMARRIREARMRKLVGEEEKEGVDTGKNASIRSRESPCPSGSPTTS